MEVDPYFHVRRGMQQSDDAQRESIKRRKAEQLKQKDIIVSYEADLDSTSSRALIAAKTIGSGIAVGGFFGFVIGSIYALKIRHQTPLGVAASSGIVLGLLGGQFMGIKYVLPIGTERFYWRFIGSEREKLSGESIIEQWTAPGLEFNFWTELTPKQQDITGSFISGSLAGYITTRLSAFGVAQRNDKMEIGHINSRGIRGGIFWGMIFGIGHLAILTYYDYRTNSMIKNKIRKMYENKDYEQLRAYMNDLPVEKRVNNDTPYYNVFDETKEDGIYTAERHQQFSESIVSTKESPEPGIPSQLSVVGFTWKDFIAHPLTTIDAYYPNALTYLPMVYTQKDYDYRLYLESKIRLLEEELREEQKMAKIRKNQKHQNKE